jgi:ATP-dependent Zn protease
MEVSLGFGADLAYLASRDEEELHARVRADRALLRAVNRVLTECLQRARALLREHRDALDGVADMLARRGRVSFDGILGTVMTAGSLHPGDVKDRYP